MQLIKDRTLAEGQRVFVYFNLHKKCFSIKDISSGLVVAHADKVSLSHAEFKVSESGRQRVLKEKRKNVHAGVVGYFDPHNDFEGVSASATYNPYLYNSFVDRETKEPITSAYGVHLENKSINYIRGN